MTISPGKLWGLRRLADEGGRFKILAMDQTGPIVNPIKQKRGLDHAPYADVVAVKTLLARHLAPQASAVLVDPPFGYTAAIHEIPARTGLVIASEWALWETLPAGRKSSNIPGWNPAVIRKIGGDAVKINLWFRHDIDHAVRMHQLAYLESVRAACIESDIAFVLELLVYPFPSESAEAFSERRADLARAALSDQSVLDPAGVELYKLEAPVPIHDVPDPDGPRAASTQRVFDDFAKKIKRPWVLLSAGATPADFLRLLTFAYRSGASGYLAGRAIWADAFAQFPDMNRMGASLMASDVMSRLNELTDHYALPWREHPSWAGNVVMDPDGRRFVAEYGGDPASACNLS